MDCTILSLSCNMNRCCTTATDAPVGLEPPMSYLSAAPECVLLSSGFLGVAAYEINITLKSIFQEAEDCSYPLKESLYAIGDKV